MRYGDEVGCYQGREDLERSIRCVLGDFAPARESGEVGDSDEGSRLIHGQTITV